MSDDPALAYLQGLRRDVLWKVEGLSESQLRRPMTGTGTNLLGLVKHLAACEFGYFQMCFDRSWPDLPFLAPDADPADDMYATADETAEQIVQLYRDAIAASDQTIAELGLDAIGRVPWWGGREAAASLLVVHMAVETARHLGHIDILREQLDGSVGLAPGGSNMTDRSEREWSDYVARLQRLADEALD